MKIVSWNIRGCKHPRKIKNLTRKVKQEKPDVLFLQETKCNSEVIEKVAQNIWRGSRVMAMDSWGMVGVLVIL